MEFSRDGASGSERRCSCRASARVHFAVKSSSGANASCVCTVGSGPGCRSSGAATAPAVPVKNVATSGAGRDHPSDERAPDAPGGCRHCSSPFVGERTDCCRIARAFEVPRARQAAGIRSDVRPPWASRSQGETCRGHRRSAVRRSRVGPRPSSVRSWSPSHVARASGVSRTSGVVVRRGARERAAAAMAPRRQFTIRCAVRALMCSRASLPFAGGSPERCAGRILENVALCFPRHRNLCAD